MGCCGGGFPSAGGGTFPPVAPVITPAWFLVGTFSHTDFQIAALTRSIALYALPAKGEISGIAVVPVVQFAGVGMTSYQVSCGIVGDTARYSALLDVLNIAPGDTVVQAGPLMAIENLVDPTSLLITAVADANLDASTAGSVEVYLKLAVLP